MTKRSLTETPTTYALELSRDEMDVILTDSGWFDHLQNLVENPPFVDPRVQTRRHLLERLQALTNPEPMTDAEALERAR